MNSISPLAYLLGYAKALMLRYSLFQLCQALFLVGFVLAAAREDEHSFSAILKSVCLGLLIWGLSSQIHDLARARDRWSGATPPERNGWCVSIGVRCFLVIALLLLSIFDETTWIAGPREEEYTEARGKLEQCADSIFPLLLICSLAIAPWHWKPRSAPPTPWRRIVSGASLLALGGMLTLIWFQASTMTALLHIAIEGVGLAQPLAFGNESLRSAPFDAQFRGIALQFSLLTLLLCIATAFFLFLRRITTKRLAQALFASLAVISVLSTLAMLRWITTIAFPKISPLLAESVERKDLRFTAAVAVICGLAGALTAIWLAMRQPAPCAREWRKAGWYIHETRFFYELFVLYLVVSNLETFSWLMEQFSQLAPLLKLDAFYTSLIGIVAGTLQSPLELATWVVAFAGLLAQRAKPPEALAQTPRPISFAWLAFEMAVTATLVYVIADAMLWSNFFYWITAGQANSPN